MRKISKPAVPVDLRPKKWRPSQERQAKMDDYLWDRQTMRVYCDYSVSQKLKAFGIAASYVYDGSVVVDSRKLYDGKFDLQPTFGELQALLYAITQLDKVMSKVVDQPDRIEVYTDLKDIDHLLNRQGTGVYGECIGLIHKAIESCRTKWPSIGITMQYLHPDEQRHNPFYSAAHHAARREALLDR